MRKLITILVAVIFMLSGTMNSAFADKIQSTELSQTEAADFAQAQADSAQTISTVDSPGSIVGAFAIVGFVVVALIVYAFVK